MNTPIRKKKKDTIPPPPPPEPKSMEAIIEEWKKANRDMNDRIQSLEETIHELCSLLVQKGIIYLPESFKKLKIQ